MTDWSKIQHFKKREWKNNPDKANNRFKVGKSKWDLFLYQKGFYL